MTSKQQDPPSSSPEYKDLTSENSKTTDPSNIVHTSTNPQTTKADSINAQASSSSKNQSPFKLLTNYECCSPSFFIDFASVRPNLLSPLIKTPTSDWGSTYTSKHLSSERVKALRPISSFDSHITLLGPSIQNKSPSNEQSPVTCKKEEMQEEDGDEEGSVERKKPKKKKTVVRKRIRKIKDIQSSDDENEDEQPKKALNDKKKPKVKKRALKKLKIEGSDGDVTEKVVKREFKEEEISTKEEKAKKNDGQDSLQTFHFESDFDDGTAELLTEDESLAILKGLWPDKRPSNMHFMSNSSGIKNISNKIVLGQEILKQRETDQPLFLLPPDREPGIMMAMPKKLTDFSLNLSKRFSKDCFTAYYECKYCGKTFDKGCALGGHISRLHKGESVTFRNRVETRKKRIADRIRGKFLKKESVRHLENRGQSGN